MAAKGRAKQEAEFVTQTHPLYDEWVDHWRLSGENYEGDGGYLTGAHIIGHPREYNYERTTAGLNFNVVTGIKPKLLRRRQLARYDNFAQALTDIFVDHQYAKGITRTFTGGAEDKDYLAWVENVDGEGTHLDDWLKDQQTLAHIYGHLPVLMDRGPSKRADGGRPRSRAEQGDLVLRFYPAPDMVDWLAPRRKLTAVKFVEAVERTNLREPAQFSATYRGTASGETKDDLTLEYLFWTSDTFEVYDQGGNKIRKGSHGFGEVPVALFYSKRRSRIPVIGRMLLKDPRLFRDHFNLVSEFRSLLRDQAFSMLHVKLDAATQETVEEAKGRLGDHAGTDNVVFTFGGATYIAPEEGPVAIMAEAIVDLERRMYRLSNLPWEADSRDAESEGSRKLKAMDLNRTLAGYADEAEKFDYKLARLFYIGRYGRDLGLRRFKENPPIIRHPDDFNTEEILAAVEDVKAGLGLQLGKTAETELRKRAVPIVLKDLDPKTKAAIDKEIETTPYSPAVAGGDFAAALERASGEADTEDEAA